jgi:hypothetical protein
MDSNFWYRGTKAVNFRGIPAPRSRAPTDRARRLPALAEIDPGRTDGVPTIHACRPAVRRTAGQGARRGLSSWLMRYLAAACRPSLFATSTSASICRTRATRFGLLRAWAWQPERGG